MREAVEALKGTAQQVAQAVKDTASTGQDGATADHGSAALGAQEPAPSR